MHYSHPCSYCSKTFYTYHSNKEVAARTLYYGIKKHLGEYNEDHKEYQFDDGPEVDSDEIYRAMSESKDPPTGGYPV